MPPTKYGKYVTREIITESKYPQITTPMARYNGCPGEEMRSPRSGVVSRNRLSWIMNPK